MYSEEKENYLLSCRRSQSDMLIQKFRNLSENLSTMKMKELLLFRNNGIKSWDTHLRREYQTWDLKKRKRNLSKSMIQELLMNLASKQLSVQQDNHLATQMSLSNKFNPSKEIRMIQITKSNLLKVQLLKTIKWLKRSESFLANLRLLQNGTYWFPLVLGTCSNIFKRQELDLGMTVS